MLVPSVPTRRQSASQIATANTVTAAIRSLLRFSSDSTLCSIVILLPPFLCPPTEYETPPSHPSKTQTADTSPLQVTACTVYVPPL